MRLPCWTAAFVTAHLEGGDLSTESITGAGTHARETLDSCASCGSPLLADQRYCLECGERRATVSEFLRSGPPTPPRQSPPAAPPGAQPPGFAPAAPAPRGNTVSLLAGIGVLLLAMGVGVLIGRSGSGSAGRAPAPQVVTVGGTGSTAPSTEEASFTSDWPAGKKGWTVELQTLPTSSTPAAVTAAKTAASGKGAKSVGALKAEEFPSVGGEGFVVYSGVYTKKAEASAALPGLKKTFPGAKVVEVSSGGGGSGSGSEGSLNNTGGSKPSEKSSLTKPAQPKSLSGHEHSSGKKYVEESSKLPNVVSTG